MDHRSRGNQNRRRQTQYQHRRRSGQHGAWCTPHFFHGDILGGRGFPEKIIPWFWSGGGTIQAASHVGFRGRIKHVDIKLECTREYVEKEVIELKYVSTKEQVADILTKRLQTPLVTNFVEKVLSNKCELSSDLSPSALVGDCAELDMVLVMERSFLVCYDCWALRYHQIDDVVAVTCKNLEFHFKEPVGLSAWTDIIADLETGIRRNRGKCVRYTRELEFSRAF